jgi:hypothetical protein
MKGHALPMLADPAPKSIAATGGWEESSPPRALLDRGDDQDKPARDPREPLKRLGEQIYNATAQDCILRAGEVAREYQQTITQHKGTVPRSATKREIVLGDGEELLKLAANVKWLCGWEMWGGLGGCVTVIFGAPKVGKTGWLRWMLAETLHFGRPGFSGNPGVTDKIWVAAFSDAGGAQYIKSLNALGARKGCMLLFDSGYYDPNGPKDDEGKPIVTGEATQVSANSDDHWARIRYLAEKHGENLILTIDDLLGWTGRADLNKPEAAAPLRKLAGICERFGSVAFVVAHSKKPKTQPDGTVLPIAIDDLSGNRALQQYARCFIGLWVPDPSKPSEIRAEWLPSNYAPEQAPIGFRRLDGNRFERMTMLPVQPVRIGKEEQAEEWLESELRKGNAPWEDLEQRGNKADHAARTLVQARSKLKNRGLIHDEVDLGPPKRTYWCAGNGKAGKDG